MDNFDDDRLKNLSLEHLRLVGEIHAELFPDIAVVPAWKWCLREAERG